MTTVKLISAAAYDSHMEMDTSILNTDISIAREVQKYISDPTRTHGEMDHGKDRKLASKRKWTDPEYHIKDSKDVPQKSAKISRDKNQFTELPFCGPYMKPHGVRGLSKHYNLKLDPKLGHEKCAILRIPCACIACTKMLDKPWADGINDNGQICYQHVVDCTYWPVLAYLNNFKTIHFNNKNTSSEDFDEVNHLVLD